MALLSRAISPWRKTPKTTHRVALPAAVPVAVTPSSPVPSNVSIQVPSNRKSEAKGVTKTTPEERALNVLDFPNQQHMLLCVPTAYIDCRTLITNLSEAKMGERGLFFLEKTGVVEAVDRKGQPVFLGTYASIFDAPYQGYWSKTAQLKVQMVDAAGRSAWWGVFGAYRLRNADRTGKILLQGELRQFGSRLFVTSAIEPPAEAAGKVWARYMSPGAPSEVVVRGLLRSALAEPESIDICRHSLVVASFMSEAQLLTVATKAGSYEYTSMKEFFQQMHEPQSPEEGARAVVAAKAMAVACVCSAASVANLRRPHHLAALNISEDVVANLIQSQAETFTSEQTLVVQELLTALRSPTPLNGLLSGDVGTGKTLPFMVIAVAAHMAQAKVAIVSPTEILANQVAANITSRFPHARVERVFAGKKIKDASAILVGTSGLNAVAGKCDYVPNFLVVDEQHKFSTRDRNTMAGAWTHLLEASATPIPRSLANTLFSGTQVFTLKNAPVQREIENLVFDETMRGTASAWIRETIASGNRVAIIYPRVLLSSLPEEESAQEEFSTSLLAKKRTEVLAAKSVDDAALSLERIFPNQVCKMHGKMTAEQIAQSLADFSQGHKSVVVASTILETGVDIKDIRLMIVKDAHNFGIAQLHQLRGRLARNGGKAKFLMMVSDLHTLAPETGARLHTVAKMMDGYQLAQADMQTRGFGDMAGDSQSGRIECCFRLLRLGFSDFGKTM